MKRLFEDCFSVIQTDMVEICLEYCLKKADKIYIYCSAENNKYTTNFFFDVHGKIVKKHKLTEEIPSCDVSTDTQGQVLRILVDDLKQLEQVCEDFERPMPTEIKMVYDVTENSLRAKYQYAIVYSDHPTKTARDIVEEWVEEFSKTF